MYTFSELIEMITQRFKTIPNVDEDDINLWLETSYGVHGVSIRETVSPDMASLIMLHAEADGVSQVALRTAYYFKFTDKDEEVDKSKVSDNYRAAADVLWKRYAQKKDEGVEGFGGSSIHYMRRIDRDY